MFNKNGIIAAIGMVAVIENYEYVYYVNFISASEKS